MAEMFHQVEIDTTPEKVYEAITTEEGLRSWWTADCIAEPLKGSIAQFGFNHRAVVFRMRIEELSPHRRIVWKCIGDFEAWNDTVLSWAISPQGSVTVLHLTHGMWRSTTGWFAPCNSTWGELMYRLKGYLEGRAPGPLVKR